MQERPCKVRSSTRPPVNSRRGGVGLFIFFFLFLFVAGWHLTRWTMCFLFDSTAPKPTFLSSALYQKQKNNRLTSFLLLFARACTCVCVFTRPCMCACACVRVRVHLSTSHFYEPSSKGATFLPGLLRAAIVSFLLYIYFFSSAASD